MVRPLVPWPPPPPLDSPMGFKPAPRPMSYVPTEPARFVQVLPDGVIAPAPLPMVRVESKHIGPGRILLVTLTTLNAVTILFQLVNVLRPWSAVAVAIFAAVIGFQGVIGWHQANRWRQRALMAEAKRRDLGAYRTLPDPPQSVDRRGWPWPPSATRLEEWARTIRAAGVTTQQFAEAMRELEAQPPSTVQE